MRLRSSGSHPGVVQLIDFWADGDDEPWLLYEYVPGGDLTDLLHRWAGLRGQQRVKTVLAAFRDVCETVGHFHRLTPSIVHRDLKPSNILVAADGRLKVADFGISHVGAAGGGPRSAASTPNMSLGRTFRGVHSAIYGSPQQRAGADADPRDDVHALGVIAYQLLTGNLTAAPDADTVEDLTAAGTPPAVIELIRECVSAKAEKRPATAAVLVARLDRAAEPEPVALIPARDHAKEERERREREQAERERKAEAEGKRAEHEAAEARRKQELQARREREQRVEREAAERKRQQEEAAQKEAERQESTQGFTFGSVFGGLLLLAIAGGLLYLLYTFLWAERKISEAQQISEGRRIEWADLKAGTTPGEEVSLPLGTSGQRMTFCWCPAGMFQRGSTEYDDEKPVREITLSKGFWTAKTETTQAQWTALGFKNESNWKGDTLPVEMVSHTQAVAFVDKLKSLSGKAVRLPTEAEWEYACRAGTKTKYHSGDTEADLAAVGWYDGNSGSKTHPVGQKKANAWGLHDMHGNVWEWCADWYDAGFYAKSPKDDPPGPESGSDRVFRGGGWSLTAWYCRAAFRVRFSPDIRSHDLGFRLAAGPSGQ